MLTVNNGSISIYSVSNLVMTGKNRLVQALRLASLAVLTLVVLALAMVQVRQQLFRHRAQLLLNDMRNLWMHPGNFDDLRHIQQRWGAFGHYDGSCTAEHCEYSITLSNPELPRWENDRLRILEGEAFVLLGGREVNIMGGIVVHNNQMVLESVWFMIDAPHAEGAIMEVRIHSAPRLFLDGMIGSEADLKRGYGIGHPQPGTNATVHVTPQTAIADIMRLTNINLDCITRIRACADMDDLLPAAWSEYRHEHSKFDPADYATKCSVSPALFAREADNIALAEVLKLHAPEYRREDITQGATIRILDSLKNNADHPVGSVVSVSFGWQSVYAGPGVLSDPNRKLAVGDRVFLLYPRLVPGQLPRLIDTGSCSLIPFSDATLKSVHEGIAMDPADDGLRDISIPY
jgi:hypothetical protein